MMKARFTPGPAILLAILLAAASVSPVIAGDVKVQHAAALDQVEQPVEVTGQLEKQPEKTPADEKAPAPVADSTDQTAKAQKPE